MTTKAKTLGLTFGLNEAIPVGATAVWGARWIFPDDQLYDRQGGSKQGDDGEAHMGELLAWLNGGAAAKARAAMAALDKASIIERRDSRRVILFSDDSGWFIGDPRSSYGYVYVVAFLRAHVPEGYVPSGELASVLLKPKPRRCAQCGVELLGIAHTCSDRCARAAERELRDWDRAHRKPTSKRIAKAARTMGPR